MGKAAWFDRVEYSTKCLPPYLSMFVNSESDVYLGSWPILGGLGLFRLSSWSAESCSGLAAVEGGECPPPLVEPEGRGRSGH